eukprot:SM000102S09190  [mRNA]  locus=s102:135613:137741:+ [translate_table: standard]
MAAGLAAKPQARRREEGSGSGGPGAQQQRRELLACPICYRALDRTGPAGLTQLAIQRAGFWCPRCRRAYSSRGGYLDLTITSGATSYQAPRLPGTELFRSPLVSFAYERGWRQSFARAGFPGADEEFRVAQTHLAPAAASGGGVLLDVSCGSGLFARRFAASGAYSAVLASDFSEAMLRQASVFIRDDPSLSAAPIALVRTDVARLPFETGSLDAVHAGAALHCSPSPANAVAEISRVLRPGGVFVATTFLARQAPFADELFKPLRKAMAQNQSGGIMKYWEPEELEELCLACGFKSYAPSRTREFIMLTAKKPTS